MPPVYLRLVFYFVKEIRRISEEVIVNFSLGEVL